MSFEIAELSREQCDVCLRVRRLATDESELRHPQYRTTEAVGRWLHPAVFASAPSSQRVSAQRGMAYTGMSKSECQLIISTYHRTAFVAKFLSSLFIFSIVKGPKDVQQDTKADHSGICNTYIPGFVSNDSLPLQHNLLSARRIK